jgi:23S rRNA pseudouridine1911/1915/1917 synthase
VTKPTRKEFEDATFQATADARIDRSLRELCPGASWGDVRRLIETGKVYVAGERVTDMARFARSGDEISIRMRAPRVAMTTLLPRDAIVHLDAQLVVVRKPPGVSTVRFDETEEGETLDEIVRATIKRRTGRAEPPLGVVHRLDKETSGLMLFARTLDAKRTLKQAFRVHAIRRCYRAVAHGHVAAQTIATRLVQDRGDGRRGSTENPLLGREATTFVRPLETFPLATLVECRLETGRTHQIRIHLAERGHPILGERVYAARHLKLLPAPRVMLHAMELGFDHPKDGHPLDFTEPIPDDMLQVMEGLRPARG